MTVTQTKQLRLSQMFDPANMSNAVSTPPPDGQKYANDSENSEFNSCDDIIHRAKRLRQSLAAFIDMKGPIALT